MPNILVLSASGYIGLAVSQALLRAGTYTVFSSAYMPKNATKLRLNEITPVKVNIVDPTSLSKTIEANHINTVIDCSSAYNDASKILKGIVTAGKAKLSAFTKAGLVHGSPNRRVSNLTPISNGLAPAKAATAMAWRPVHEQSILAARNTLNVAILRLLLTYGRASWAWAYFGPLLAAKSDSSEPIQIPADATARTSLVHVNDLAAAFVNATDRIDGRLGSWPVFNIFTQTLAVPNILEAAKKALAIKAPLKYIGTMGNPFLKALSLVCNGENLRARLVLGWELKRINLIRDMPAIIQAWKAA